jgi:hypothetical protein
MASTTQSTQSIHDAKNLKGVKNKIHPEILEQISDTSKIHPINYNHSFSKIDYIDSIKVEDVQHPISFGIDSYGRAFVAIKYTCNGKEIVETLFQRYTRDIWNWTVGTSMEYSGVLQKSGYFLEKNVCRTNSDEKTLALIKEICDNGFVYNTPTEDEE